LIAARRDIGKTLPLKIISIQTALLCLLLTMTWALTHHYVLSGDGELYAFQAMARTVPALRHDVYLASTSQDQFTLFSPLFSWAIRWFGLLNGAAILFVLCTVSLFAAAWAMARALWDGTIAWLAVAMLVVTVAGYGGSGVFHCAENYLTARSLAEALVVSSLALRYLGHPRLSWGVALLAAFIHPLMALPGLLLLTCLSVSWPLALLGAIVGIALILAIEAMASLASHPWNAFSIMDDQWLEVVRERSQFLFLKYWKLSDWEMHARILMSLAIGALSSEDANLRRLCAASAIVGVTGLIIALIAGSLGPVPILIQGQAWRWFWVTGFVSVLMILPSAFRLWKGGGCGPACATLLVAGWTFSRVDGSLLVAAALCLWALRRHMAQAMQRVLIVLSFALIAALLVWTIANIWSACTTPLGARAGEPMIIERLRGIYALPTAALALFALAWKWMGSNHSGPVTAASGVLMIVVCAFAMKGSFSRPSTAGTDAEIEAFSDWRAAIPATSNVLLVPTRNSAGFVWFSLQRPSYLSVNQSAGVVFSPITAGEIRRRSQVLLPIMEPDWRLLSQNTLLKQGRKLEGQTRPLTAERLVAICTDPQLGFVIAKESLGFGAQTHTKPGEWQGWNLYDCRQVHSSDTAV